MLFLAWSGIGSGFRECFVRLSGWFGVGWHNIVLCVRGLMWVCWLGGGFGCVVSFWFWTSFGCLLGLLVCGFVYWCCTWVSLGVCFRVGWYNIVF